MILISLKKSSNDSCIVSKFAKIHSADYSSITTVILVEDRSIK